MGKKSKRSRKSNCDDNVVSDSDLSNHDRHPAGATAPATALGTGEAGRTAPALRSAAAAAETAETARCEDPYEDIYEEEGEDGEYEDVYESSGDEDEEYMEAMVTGDDAGAARMAAASAKEQRTTAATSAAASAATATAAKIPAIDRAHGANPPSQVKSWNPFEGHAAGTSLEMDETAYRMHHALTPEWPALTLDVVPDRHLGDHRTRFPHTVTLVAGSQADGGRNKLTVLRLSDLSRTSGAGREKTERELDDEMLGEEWKRGDADEEESDEDAEEDGREDEEEDLDPVLEHYAFPHACGGINRVRVCPHNADIVAVWSDSGVVSLYDIGGALDVLDRSARGSQAADRKDGAAAPPPLPPRVRPMRKDPFFVYAGHSSEGFAMDWSRVTPGRLATADCDGNIHVWDATHPVSTEDIAAQYKHKSSPWGNASFTVQPTYAAHGENLDNPSVEDLQWSPTEATVLASAECGGYVRIYDTRCPGKAMISNKVHASGADVNVISWNRLVGNLLASGGDDGSFSVWDLRSFNTAEPKPLARFQSHRTPITSLEWHPSDESMIAVSDDNGTYVYDLSIEEDDPEGEGGGADANAAAEGAAGVAVGHAAGEIPPQLLFVHSGSTMTKEVHWHPQIPSCVATTSLSGFSVFIPSNL